MDLRLQSLRRALRAPKLRAAAALMALTPFAGPCRTFLVHGAPFVPPDRYAMWYAEMEACVGRRGRYDKVRWFVLDSTIAARHAMYGVWQPPHGIYLAGPAVASEAVVRHEMIHDLIGAGHPVPPFDACAPRWPTLRGEYHTAALPVPAAPDRTAGTPLP